MSDQQLAEAAPTTAEAARYRREAAEIREVLGLIRDERFREQLLSIANQYEALAAYVEKELQSLDQQHRDLAAD